MNIYCSCWELDCPVSINSYIAKQFSHPVGFGGKLVSFVMNQQNLPLYENTILLLPPLSEADSVLDIGCGNGCVLNILAKRYDCKFAGIDISKSIIKAASQRNKRYLKEGRMELMCQDVSRMPFADCSFTKAYSINTVYFWEDVGRTMAEIQRIMKPNGIFINTLYSSETLMRFSHTQFGYKQFTVEQLVREGENAGFSVEVVPIVNGAAHCVIYHKSK